MLPEGIILVREEKPDAVGSLYIFMVKHTIAIKCFEIMKSSCETIWRVPEMADLTKINGQNCLESPQEASGHLQIFFPKLKIN